MAVEISAKAEVDCGKAATYVGRYACVCVCVLYTPGKWNPGSGQIKWNLVVLYRKMNCYLRLIYFLFI